MNKFEIDSYKKTIKIVNPISVLDLIDQLGGIPDFSDFIILPSANDITNHFNYSNSALGAPFDENFD